MELSSTELDLVLNFENDPLGHKLWPCLGLGLGLKTIKRVVKFIMNVPEDQAFLTAANLHDKISSLEKVRRD